jgi:hypothetical protein
MGPTAMKKTKIDGNGQNQSKANCREQLGIQKGESREDSKHD